MSLSMTRAIRLWNSESWACIRRPLCSNRKRESHLFRRVLLVFSLFLPGAAPGATWQAA